MGGYDHSKVVQMIGLDADSDEYSVEAMIAIGHPDLYNAGFEKVTQRNEVEKFISEGQFVEKLDPPQVKDESQEDDAAEEGAWRLQALKLCIIYVSLEYE